LLKNIQQQQQQQEVQQPLPVFRLHIKTLIPTLQM